MRALEFMKPQDGSAEDKDRVLKLQLLLAMICSSVWMCAKSRAGSGRGRVSSALF